VENHYVDAKPDNGTRWNTVVCGLVILALVPISKLMGAGARVSPLTRKAFFPKTTDEI
jgi:hypothetical protein